jgi:hypothetical protein
MSSRQSDEKMDVIGNSPDLLRNTFEIFDNSTKKGMEPRLLLGCNQAHAVFCAKDEVIMEG